jgi:hypothetical protein
VYRKGYNKYLFNLITISFAVSILSVSTLSSDSVFAQKNGNDDDDDKKEDKGKLIVKASIDLENVDMKNTKFIRVIGFINGEEAKQDIPISSIDKSNNNLNVELKVNEENDIVEADTPDEFFVCGYQVGKGDISKESTIINLITKFDCNEGDILGNPTKISLFKSGSQVYSKSQEYYQGHLNMVNNNNTANDAKVKIKIIAPLADKKDTEKLVIAAMIKGQIQSEVTEDVQAELDKSKEYNTKNFYI